jgi:hypothetical protein
MDYQKLYARFIADRKEKEQSIVASGVYTERHHITPKSMGGDNSKDNLIRLTAGDHYFAHLILAKCYGGKMWLAVSAMCDMPGASKKRDFYAKRRWVSIAREESRIIKSQNTKRLHKNPDYVAKLHSPEAREKYIKTMTNLYATTDLAQRRAKAQRAAFATPEHKKLMSEIQKKVQNNPETSAKRSEKMRNFNPMQDQGVRDFIAQKVRERCATPEFKETMSKRLMNKDHPIHSAEARIKSNLGIKKAREKNPLAYSKTPVLYLGELRPLKTVCKEIGISPENISTKAKREGKSTQEIFDWYLNTTKEFRMAQRKPKAGFVEYNGKMWTKKDLCENYGVSVFKIYDIAKKNGTDFMTEFSIWADSLSLFKLKH